MSESLYTRLGGEKSLEDAVNIFYKKVLSDVRIKHFFEDVNTERMARMQTAFLSFAFGGPHRYTGRSLRSSHARLVENGLNDAHFDVVIEHLGSTLKELNVPNALIAEATEIAESVRSDVLGK